ncbi:hypothetical protein ALC56_10453, partial [Trachymyrmex septentrionalis]
RISKANRRTSESSREARTARRLERLMENEFYEEEEGLLYGPLVLQNNRKCTKKLVICGKSQIKTLNAFSSKPHFST